MFCIKNTPLDESLIFSTWMEDARRQNHGALLTFCGIVRKEGGISALSFDIKESMLLDWFKSWEQRFDKSELCLYFAHSRGDVKVHEVSFLAGVLSHKRKLGLRIINDFVEDFKANAPIWKYDIIDGKRVFAMQRSFPLKGAGLLS